MAYWDEILSVAADLFESRPALNRSIACVRIALPHVTDAIAYCALAECCGRASDAVEKLLDPSYEREVAYVCTVIDIVSLLQATSVDSGGSATTVLPTSPDKTTAALQEGHCGNVNTSLTPDGSPVRFPSIAHPFVAASEAGTSTSGGASDTARSSTASATSPRVALPSCMPASLASTHSPHKATATARAKATTLHVLANDSVAVLHDFRHVNSLLLRSQQSFGGSRS